MTKDELPSFGGKTIEEWNQEWVRVPDGLKHHQSQLTYVVGLYRYRLHSQDMALGTGTDSKGGIAKRLSDFIRPGWSGRSHHAGQLIFEHRKKLELWVLITGSGPAARSVARRLKAPMEAFHQPAWNAPNPNSETKRKAKPRRRPTSMKVAPVLNRYVLRGAEDAGPLSQMRA